jgi:methylated-DNA-protein-cysteine methyltransferase-like protein
VSSGARAVGADGEAPGGERTTFERAVVVVLDGLRPGEVVTYGEVAAEAGYPGAARAVGSYLARCGDGHAWWRVVTTAGRLVPGHEAEHARRLRAEGVRLVGRRVVWPGAAPRRR